LMQKQRWALLLQQIGRMSTEQRTVIELTYYHGCAYREIAQIMGCPVDTVKTRMFHARKRLRQFLSATRGGVLMMGRVLSFARSPPSDDTGAAALVPERLALGGGEAEEVEEHLRGCAECRSELEAVRLLHSALHRQ